MQNSEVLVPHHSYTHEPEPTAATSTSNHALDGIIDLVGGTLGGVSNAVVGQPLDTIKVKMQTFSKLYRNSVHCFTATVQQSGLKGLYAGLVPALAANVGENAILFCAYGACQKVVCRIVGKDNIKNLSPVENAFAGSGAAFFASFALCPTELIKCRLQAMREMQSTGEGSMGKSQKLIGPWALTKQILKAEGIPGMFRGLTPTFAREVPGYFFFFGGYELSRAFFTPPGKTKDDIGWCCILCTVISGGIGGMSLWGIIFPADVIKSKMQVEGSGSIVGTGLHVFRKEGIKGLYKGFGPSMLRTFFATGSLFLTYEYSTKFMHDYFDK